MNKWFASIVAILILLPGINRISIAQNGEMIRDIDGNVYSSVKTGRQIWLRENLKTTRFNDGTPLPHITADPEWNGRTSPAYCWYNNDSTNKADYGALYNWYAISSGNLCPAGWHVPSDSEWHNPGNVSGDLNEQGSALKEKGYSHWQTFDPGGTNSSGMTMVPGGYRSSNGRFTGIGQYGFIWSSSEFLWDVDTYYTRFSWGRYLCYYNSMFYRYYFEKKYGFSVRCLKDTIN